MGLSNILQTYKCCEWVKLLRGCAWVGRGEENTFEMRSRNLGKLTRCYVGLAENEILQTTTKDSNWHCDRVIVTNNDTGDK